MIQLFIVVLCPSKATIALIGASFLILVFVLSCNLYGFRTPRLTASESCYQVARVRGNVW